MTFGEQTLQNPLPAPSDRRNHTGYRSWRWVALICVLGILVASAVWAWPRFINTSQLPSQPSTPVVINTAGTSGTTAVVASTQPQPVVEKSAAQAPEQQQPATEPSAAVVVTTTQATPGMVVIAGTDGATVLTTPDGEQIGTLTIGALVNATGRSEDGAWLYGSSADGTTGWVAVNQIIAFGIEKLSIVTVTAPLPAAVAATEQASAPTPATITATAEIRAATEVTAAALTTATNSIPVAETVTETASGAAATDEPSPASATGVTATVMVTGARLNIRSGPGTRYGIVDKADRNETVTVLARNEAADWVQIALSSSEDGFGWVAASYLRLSSAIADLPVSAAVSVTPIPMVATTPSTASSTSTSASTSAGTSTIQVVDTATVAQLTVAPQAAAAVSASPATGLHGTLVFQSSPGGMIYAYNLDTGRLGQLTHGFDPAISPDGQTVAFVRTAGDNGLYLIHIDGSNERLIFSGRNTLAAPKWSPDGSYIVFARGDEYKECRDLGRGGCLTDKELLDQNPNFPVNDYPLIKDYESNLARVDSNGDNYRDLANLESARAADWNEAGIVYQSSAGLQITQDKPDATSQLVIHDPNKPAYEDPDWQPNGGKIAFVSRGGNHREIYTVNPDGSGMTALTRPVTTLVDELPNNVAPAWSPDGQHIVYLSNRADNNSAGAWKLWVMNADGSNQHPLPIDVTINYTYGNEQLVSWGEN